MANKRYRGSAGTSYVYGNAAHQYETAEPQRKSTRKENRELTKNERKELHHAQRVNFLYTAVVVSVVAVMFVICLQYLQLQANLKTDASKVNAMEAKLEQLTLSNDEAEVQIKGSINYDAILDTAVNELGMVYPNKQQVITYHSGESEYVKQYQDIPASK